MGNNVTFLIAVHPFFRGKFSDNLVVGSPVYVDKIFEKRGKGRERMGNGEKS